MRFSVRLAGILLLLISAAMVYIFTCSTRSYTTRYTEEEWLPVVAKGSNRRVVQYTYDANASSFNHNLASALTNVTHSRSEDADSVSVRKLYKPHPRVVFSGGKTFKAVQGRRIRSRYDLGSLRKRSTRGRPSWSLPTNTTFCVPKKSWQTTSFPTCNTMHEISLTNENEEQTRILGTGGWRATWKVDNNQRETVAFKTLK